MQEPFAIIIGCSDSRVPVEIVFDQDLGDLFGGRVAGNIVAPSQLGSVEFAAAEFGTPLVVVLGHSHCGAVLGTLERLRRPAPMRSPHFRFIADQIEPAVAALLAPERGFDRERLVRESVRTSIRQSVAQLRHGSTFLDRQIEEGRLRVVGAESLRASPRRVEFRQCERLDGDAHPVITQSVEPAGNRSQNDLDLAGSAAWRAHAARVQGAMAS